MYYNMKVYNEYGLIQLANFTNDPHILKKSQIYCKFISLVSCARVYET